MVPRGTNYLNGAYFSFERNQECPSCVPRWPRLNEREKGRGMRKGEGLSQIGRKDERWGDSIDNGDGGGGGVVWGQVFEKGYKGKPNLTGFLWSDYLAFPP